ncbi:hypothetical protein DEO72_LG7g402 [Vigna unguiculata]|uniref:Uncharacterized protein n=1 Tax=Vigna unguiculata TaxID=3917 RepID=A0A4D6MCH2_VIGUN|nr:hypothetical protein DEO72_LG7g402 [Vigna unguiculata]
MGYRLRFKKNRCLKNHMGTLNPSHRETPLRTRTTTATRKQGTRSATRRRDPPWQHLSRDHHRAPLEEPPSRSPPLQKATVTAIEVVNLHRHRICLLVVRRSCADDGLQWWFAFIAATMVVRRWGILVSVHCWDGGSDLVRVLVRVRVLILVLKG